MPLTEEDAKSEIYSSTPAFSDRWVRVHGLPEKVRRRQRNAAGQGQPVVTEFSSSEVFSVLQRSRGTDPTSLRRLGYLKEAYGQTAPSSLQLERFTEAVDTGFVPLVKLRDGLKSGRIDELAEALKRGPTAEGIAKWLLYDQETRRCLTLLLRLQGYQVADEALKGGGSISDRMDKYLDPTSGKLLSVQFGSTEHAFSDFINITDDEIKAYLKAVAGVVGTDPGVAELAYTIFRVLGHPHQNGKYADELIKKYIRVLTPEELNGVESPFIRKFNDQIKGYSEQEEFSDYFRGDLDPREIAPFIVKFKAKDYGGLGVDKTFEEVLTTDGVLGLVKALNGTRATQLVREWNDMQTMLDMMDKISDIRIGAGAAGALSFEKKIGAIQTNQEFLTMMAKRKISKETRMRIIDPKKISAADGDSSLSREEAKQFVSRAARNYLVDKWKLERFGFKKR